MIYNFRFDRDEREEVLRRLREEKLLSQGWGGGSEGGLPVSLENYPLRVKEFYELNTTRIPTNLLRMRDFRDGDLLVTPHLPEDGTVSIHVVDGHYPKCYDYLENDPTHLNHRIRVKESYGLDGSISIYTGRLAGWYGRLSWLRLPILPIPDLERDFRSIIATLQEAPGTILKASDLDGYLRQMFERIVQQIKKDLYDLSASHGRISFEAVCEHLLSSFGYRVVARHQYDGAGGDVDIRCVRRRESASPFETGEVLLFVQVKKHEGVTDKTAVEQLLKMMENEPDADGCVMTLADDFDEQAKKLADDNGIGLLNGDSIARLVLRNLADRFAGGGSDDE